MLLRTALGGHLGIPPVEVPISLDAEGKPHLRHAEEWAARFNISHTENFVVVGLTELSAIGVDVEELRRPLNVEILLKNYFSSAEYAECMRYPAEERKAAFLRGWTRKEAAWKYFGGESRMPWQHIAVSFDDDSSTHIRLTGDSAGAGLLLDSFTWQPAATCIASAVFHAPATTRPRHISQPKHAVGFGGVRQLVWNLETSMCYED
jgi:4'-phosphopantetheinyl transferase